MAYNAVIRGKMYTYFIQRLGVKPHRTGWLRAGTCPSCGKQLKFGVDLYRDRCNCFSCEYRPKPIKLIMKLESLETYGQVFKFLGAFEGAELLDSQFETPLETKVGKLPESFKLLSIGTSRVANIARNYVKKRGFDPLKLSMKGVGYCTRGEYALRIIFPFYENGKLVYFNAREFVNTGFRFKNPSVEEFGTGKSMLMYNGDSLKVYKRIYVVESITNAETLGERAIAIGGKVISDYQLSKIIASPVEEVVIILDPDAYWEALKTGLKLANYKKIKVLNMPRLPSKKDPSKFLDVNDLGRKKVLKLVKAMPWQKYADVFREFVRTPKPKHSSDEA